VAGCGLEQEAEPWAGSCVSTCRMIMLLLSSCPPDSSRIVSARSGNTYNVASIDLIIVNDNENGAEPYRRWACVLRIDTTLGIEQTTRSRCSTFASVAT
jgi:hypothetical protein